MQCRTLSTVCFIVLYDVAQNSTRGAKAGSAGFRSRCLVVANDTNYRLFHKPMSIFEYSCSSPLFSRGPSGTEWRNALQTKELCRRATEEVGKDNGVTIANYLCPGNYAVSGGVQGCDAVEKLAKEYKARCMRLAVAGAFHTRYMQPAEEKLRSIRLIKPVA